MTTEIVDRGPLGSEPSLLERAQALMEARIGVEMREDPYRGRYLARIELAPLDGAQRELLELAKTELLVRLGPGADREIVKPLARMANLHSKDRSAEEWKMLFEDYCFDLREFSPQYVVQSCLEHRRTSKWFPTISELRARCLELRELDRSRLERCVRNLALDRPA